MRVRLSILFFPCILLLVSAARGGLGLQYETPVIEGFHPLDDEAYEASQLSALHPIVLKLNSKLFKDTSDIDFEKRQITFSRVDSLGYIMWEYHYGELSDYLLARRNFALFKGWHDEVLKARNGDEKDKDKSMKLQWELPVQYPSWAQRILGNEPPKLSINGKLGISIGYDDSRKTNNASDKDAQSNGGGFQFDQTYQFSITGSVGRLININISASSDEEFSMSNNLKNFKIDYKESTPGELEDEIIQEVTAGYTDFDMPGTSLSGYSESHKGLFGIKIKSKLGPLSLTTIASTEQGESQKFTKSSSNSSTEGSAITEDRYEANKFFFLDNEYRKYYNYNHAPNPHKSNPPPKVTEISIWRQVEPTKEQEDIKNNIKVRNQYVDTISQTYRFEELIRNRHFWLNEEEGYIRFADSANIQNTDRIAIYFRTAGSIKRGEKLNDSTYLLWTLKPTSEIESAKDDPERFYLMWRNVYSLQVTNLNDLKIKIKRVNPDINDDEHEQDTTQKTNFYTYLLGLANAKGELNKRADVFDVTNQVLIIPPYDTSFYGNEPFRNNSLGNYCDSVIYMYSPTSRNRVENYKPKYNLYMGSTSKQTSFNLDYGVMEGTEKVTINGGAQLERDRDYTIDYNMGTLELTSPRAKAAQKVDIEYQRDAVFVPDRKGFLGVHGEMALPFLSENSFVGGSILYQGTKTTDDIPRLGQEPYWKLLFDLNTKIDLQPEWMTTLVNKIPLVHTDAQSSASLEVEVARSIMNPNRDNESYVDDFEEAKESYSLGEDYKSWHKASPPYASDTLNRYPPAWDYYWFTPNDYDKDNRIKSHDIYVKTAEELRKEENSNESVLRFNCVPASTDPTLRDRYKNAWAGIMYSISKSFADRTRDQYFEFIVNSTDAKGTLDFQMGDMREDISNNGGPPNMRADKEDTSLVWRSTIPDSLDLGLDKAVDDSEICLVPKDSGNGWETLKYGDSRLGEWSKDPSKDDFRDYDKDHSNTGKYACRTQGNAIPDDEDINFDGTVNYSNPEKYFSFKIDLKDTSSPFIDKTARLKGGWKKYRIPLKTADSLMSIMTKVGDPSWMQIYTVRIIWNGFDQNDLTREQKLILTKMEFVGNQWETVSDSSSNKIEASVINTEDDSEYVKILDPKLKREDPTMRGVYKKEQSLKLKFKHLKRGEEAIVKRNLSYQPFDLSPYENLNLMVYGRDTIGTGSGSLPLYKGKIKFVFRFGSDSSTYYEYNRPIKPGWNNNIKINLRALAKYKDSMMVIRPDSAIYDSSGEFIIRAPAGRQPNFAKITWMALGVKRDGDYIDRELDSTFGEIYVDEMTVTGINKLDGYAARASVGTKFADFLDLSASMNYGNGDFRTMTDNQIISSNSNLSGTVNADVNLNKFLPSQWGVSLPVGASVNSSVSRPQLKTGSDVSLNEGKSDGFLDMAGDLADMALNKNYNKDITRSERYETKTLGKSVYTNYSKSSESDNVVSNLTADRIKTDFKYNSSVTETHLGPTPDNNETDYVRIDSSDTYSGKLEYDLSPKNTPSWTKWSPFSKTKNIWIPPKLKNYELSLLPSKIDFDLADVSYGWTKKVDTKNSKTPISNRTFDLNHGFSFEYFPINPLLSMDYNVNINRDLDTIADDSKKNMIDKVFSSDSAWHEYFMTFGESKRTQHAGLKLNPDLFDWFSTTAEYSSDYTGNVVKWSSDPENYLNLGVTTALTLNATLDIGKILGDLASATAKSGAASFFSMMDKGFNKIGMSGVQFTYTANSNLLNNNISPDLLSSQNIDVWDFIKYQLGMGNRGPVVNYFLGDMDDNAFGGMRSRLNGSQSKTYYQNDQRSVNRDYRLSTGLSLTTPFEIRFDPISIGWTKQIKRQPDTTYYDSCVTSPDFSIAASTPALQKISIVEKLANGLNLRSSFSYKNAKHWGSTGSDSSQRFDFSPLVSLSGTVKKWPINFNYAHNHTIDKQFGNMKFINKNDDDNLDVSYSIESKSRLSQIKILKWTIPVRGKTTTGFNFTHSHKVEPSSTTDETTFSVAPYLSYIFTDNVTGKIDYKFSRTTGQVGDTQTNNLFLLSVDIVF